MAFYTQDQLQALGLKLLGQDVKISDKASLYNPAKIEIGDNSRIDDFCVLSAGDGGIYIGRHVHIAVHCSLVGSARIEMHDFSGLSSRVSIYSSSDDYSGEFMTNPTIPSLYTNVTCAPVVIERHVIVGSGAVILPGVTMREGACAGALTLIKRNCDEFGIYFGIPAKRVGDRSKSLLDQERKFSRS